MTLTSELKPETEAQLREEAARKGLDASSFAALALEEQLRPSSNPGAAPPHLSAEESVLLQKINQGLPEALWQE